MESTTDLERIITALNMEELAPEEQQDLMLELNSLVFRSALTRIVEQMDEATRTQFTAFVDTNPIQEQLAAFLIETVPGADKAVEDTVAELTSDILSVTENK